jgi:hypothetical protein
MYMSVLLADSLTNIRACAFGSRDIDDKMRESARGASEGLGLVGVGVSRVETRLRDGDYSYYCF